MPGIRMRPISHRSRTCIVRSWIAGSRRCSKTWTIAACSRKRWWSRLVNSAGRPRVGVSTSGNSNAPDGRDHWPYCYSAVVAGCGIARGAQYGESDQTASSPKDKPVHPNDLLATTYYALGIDPDMQVLNHLNQPRELVKGKVVTELWT